MQIKKIGDIPLIIERGRKPGPTLWLNAVTHGDEIVGLDIIRSVFAHLKKHPLQAGTLYATPILNWRGFQATWRGLPQSNEDLNRSFPGDPEGTAAERVAAQAFAAIGAAKPDLVIDLHSDSYSAIPYIMVDHPNSLTGVWSRAGETAWKMADRFGITVAYDLEDENYRKLGLERTLTAALINRLGVPAFVVELGGQNIRDERYAAIGRAGVINCLRELGMFSDENEPFVHPTKIVGKKRLQLLKDVICNQDGVLEYLAKPGDRLRRGDKLARITDPFGRVLETVRAQRDYYVITLTDQAVAFAGREIATVAA
jgi:hypothetical protein